MFVLEAEKTGSEDAVKSKLSSSSSSSSSTSSDDSDDAGGMVGRKGWGVV